MWSLARSTIRPRLEPGESYRTLTGSLTIPKWMGGNVYVIVRTDSAGQINEYPMEGNNTVAATMNVIPLPPADLVTSNVVAPDQAFDGSTIEVRYKVTNLGAAVTNRDSWTDAIWMTRDKNRPHPNAGDVLLATFSHSRCARGGESYDQVVRVRIPTSNNVQQPADTGRVVHHAVERCVRRHSRGYVRRQHQSR